MKATIEQRAALRAKLEAAMIAKRGTCQPRDRKWISNYVNTMTGEQVIKALAKK